MSATSLLLQLIVILSTARICGWVLRHVGQPSVVGEMAAGLMLGPVVMGALFPSLHAQLIELMMLAGWYHSVSYVCNAARVPLEAWAARW